MSSDRRRSPRIALLGQVHGHIAALDVQVRVCEMSLGGLSMETPFVFAVGSLHDFSLTLGDGAAVLLKGEVVYSKPLRTRDGSPVFLTGVQFVDDGEDPAGPEQIIDRITS